MLGDGEELLPKFIDAIYTRKNLSRNETLRELSSIEGIYIPILYSPKYTKSGVLIDIEPVDSNIPSSITKQTWKGENLCHSTVITPNSAWPNIHLVEVVRSCPELCRFCLASYLTLPFRSPSLEKNLIPAVEKGLKITKRLGLLGASVTQHPEFSELIDWLNEDQFDDLRVSISSVRASTVNPRMMDLLQKRGCKSITIAIESGSQKIRDLINKKLTEEEIFSAARYTYESGMKNLKLYGMVGLPGEDESDIESTADLLIRLKKKTKGLRLKLGLSTFVPKAHTPFQWYGVKAEAKKRIKILTKKLQSNGIELRAESFGWSLIQTLISRSDRRLAPVIEAVRKLPNISLGSWKQAYISAYNRELDSDDNYFLKQKLPSWEEIIYSAWDHEKTLPWEHLNGPLKKDQLIKHQKQSFKDHFD